MKLLLDTHTFLWFVSGNSKLSKSARELIEDMSNTRLLSIACLWEIAIKVSANKLQLEIPFATFIPQQLRRNVIDVLGISVQHVNMIAGLPYHHRDPFDRMLVVQSIVENIPIISIDQALDAYNITRLW